MSPNVNSFVHDLVAMAKAMEEVPALESRIREMQEQLDKALSHNQGLEQNIQSYKTQIESLQTKNHDLEVARDDAEYRFLELDEKTYKILGDIEAINTLAQATREMLKPKLPEPPPAPQDQSEFHPTTVSTPQPDQSQPVPSQPVEQTPSVTSPIEPNPNWAQPNPTPTAQPEGQREPLPTSTPTNVGSETGSSPPASTESAESQTTASQSSPDTRTPGRYAGKRYYDYPSYIPRADWVAEGGSQEDYDWRPNRQQSAE